MSDRGAAGGFIAAVIGGAVATGLLVGVLLGTTGTIDIIGESATIASPETASFYQCPGGTDLGSFAQGDRILITGSDASGDWVEVRAPSGGDQRVWMRSRQVLADADISELPVVSCLTPVIAVAGDGTATTTIATDTTTTTVPGTSTTTTAAVTTTTTTIPPPTVGTVTATNDPIWEAFPDDAQNCINQPNHPIESVIRAPVSAPAGVDTVFLHWSVGGFSGSKPMGQSGGDYVGILGKFYNDNPNAVPEGQTLPITVIVRVTDDLGRQAESQIIVDLNDCSGPG